MSDSAIVSAAPHLLITLDSVPGDHYSAIRRSRSSYVGRLLRQFAGALHGERLSGPVRGTGVAVDNVAQALIEHSQLCAVTLLVAAGLRPSLERWLKEPRFRASSHRTRILSRADLLAESNQTLWLELNGYTQDALAIREGALKRVYSVVGLQHGVSAHPLLYDKYLRILLRRTYPFDSIVCSTRACRKAVRNILDRMALRFEREFGAALRYEGRLDVVPLCVDTFHFHPGNQLAARAKARLPKDGFVLLYVGLISPLKADLVPLLLVLRQLKRQHFRERILLVVAGTGPREQQNALSSTVRDLELSDSICFKCGLNDDEMGNLYRAADVFVSPTDTVQESFGLAPVEAMASGLPQVVSDWDGYRETVRHGETGFLIPSYWGRCDGDLVGTGALLGWQHDHVTLGQSVAVDTRRMEDALTWLLRNPERRVEFGRRSRELAVQEFSYAAVVKKYESLFLDLHLQVGHAECAATPRQFDQPAYFDTFYHYASQCLDERSLLRIRCREDLNPELLVKAASRMRPGASVISVALIQRIMGFLMQTAQRDGGPSEIRQIAAAVAGSGSPEIVVRHVLWLVKYGYLEIDL